MRMRRSKVAEDLIPIGEFTTHASRLLRRMRATRRPLVITQNGRAAGVVLTPEEYDALGGREALKAAIDDGIASARAGTVTLEDALARARRRIAAVARAKRSDAAR